MTNNIVKFPKQSDLDKQFMELEKQRETIRDQSKLIKKMEQRKNDS
tara:strand:- start:361 stop:498 length:138 start_codon:yes stop_codon:yes gene_type:complete